MLKIWGRKTSSNVQKVLWCCGELGLAFERVDLGGPFGGNREPEYLALNPNGLVPTIEDDGFVLWESNSIVRYLAAKHGSGGLWPTEPRRRADTDRWMDWQATTVGPLMVAVFQGLVRTPPEERDAAKIEATRKIWAASWSILDAHLADEDYVAGGTFSVADIALGIMAYRWFTLEIEREEFAHLAAWYQRLCERPPFREHVMLPLS